jgi:hypothetical protein
MARLLFILWLSAIVMGLAPTSHHMLSMQAMSIEEKILSHPNSMEHGNGEENSTASCCDEMSPFSQACSFLAPQYACIEFFGGSKQVINSNPLFHYIYIETLTPPPKA